MAVTLLGCATDAADVEDSPDDVFLTDDAKADAFGVEDWSPDGAAVLQLVSTASQSKLDDDVGLSARTAKRIVDARASLTGGKYTDLAQLDAVPYVGKTVFARLLAYVNDNHLFKTSLRVPLLLEDENGDSHKPLSSLNDQMVANGLKPFGRFTFVDANTDFSSKMDAYNARVQELATKTMTEITDSMLMYAYSYSDYEGICYIGDAKELADVITGQAGVMVGEMYMMDAWRHGHDKWVDDNIEDENDLEDDFKNYDTSSDDVMFIYSNDDDGTHLSSDVIPRCR
jgi:hypothetical protein